MWLALLVAAGCARALTPLTEIEPEDVELGAFAATLLSALKKAHVVSATPVIHVVGATSVEDRVDWSALCLTGAIVLLVGPQVEPIGTMTGSPVVPRVRPRERCVTVVRGLYSQSLLVAALGAGHPSATPDLAVALNADIYMHYWRRTLAELLLLARPVVVTFYCKYEGRELSAVLEHPATGFSASALEKCDAYVRKRYRGDADAHLTTLPSRIPRAAELWAFERNPSAHAAPVSCTVKPFRHGVRNSFWMGFAGQPEAGSTSSSSDSTSSSSGSLDGRTAMAGAARDRGVADLPSTVDEL